MAKVMRLGNKLLAKVMRLSNKLLAKVMRLSNKASGMNSKGEGGGGGGGSSSRFQNMFRYKKHKKGGRRHQAIRQGNCTTLDES